MFCLWQIGTSCKRLSRQAKKLSDRTKTSVSFEDARREDRYFHQARTNSLHALTINIALTQHSIRQARIGRPIPRDEVYTLRTTKSVQQEMRIRLGKMEPVFSTGLLDSGSEANLVSQKFIKQMNLPTPTMSNTKKLITIDGRRVQTYGVHLLNFEITDRLGRTRFFKDTFLACDCENTFVLGMPWLSLANPDIDWTTKEKNHLQWQEYNAQVALETTRRVELTDAETFAEAAMDLTNRVYVMHVKHVPTESTTTTGEVVSSMDIKQRDYDKNPKVVLPSEYEDLAEVFSEADVNRLSDHGPHDHAIDLIDERQPPYRPVYNLSEVELTVLRQYIDKHLANNFIRPSKSPARAPILFIKRPSGELRLCVDYRGLNNITIKNRYPLPLIGESLDRLGKAKRFTQLDLTLAYHQIQIKKRDEWKTAFRTRYGHFKYQVLPFGLTNAPATFQAYINKALAEKLDVFCIVYLDDILIYSEDPGKHVENVRWVLQKLKEANLFVNLQKCNFDAKEVKFLGYVVSSEGVKMEDSHIDAI